MQDESDRITDYFRSTVEDLTPSSARDEARVLFAPASFDPEVVQRFSSILSDTELGKAGTFLTAELQNRFIQRRAFRRFCAARALGSDGASLSNFVFEETDEGRPYLSRAPKLWFSFSSFRFGFLGAWSFTHGVGVDIEDQAQDLETVEVAEQFFSDEEVKLIDDAGAVERAQSFFRLWSLKESALKSIGEGLPFGLDAFGFELSPNLRVSRAPAEYGGPDRFRPHLIEGNTTCAALVTHLR